MKKSSIEITILIATYNSKRTLEKVLQSIKRQTLPKNKIEVLIVDGGSTDETIKIARKYKCKVLYNEKTDALNGKYLGFMKAQGRYLIGLDHDEVFKSKRSLEKRLRVFTENQDIKSAHSSGYITPLDISPINHYVNEFGDPFSFFVYRLSKDYRFFIKVMKSKYKIVKETKDFVLLDIDENKRPPLMELLAGAAMVDRVYILKRFKKLSKTKEIFLPHLHIHLLKEDPRIAIIKNDELLHYSAESFNKYLKKLEWRVRNNIYFRSASGAAGYLQREDYENKSRDLKKYLFIPYALSIVLPLVDSIYLATTRKNFFYLTHIFLSVYTAILIMYHLILRQLGYNPNLTIYDGSKK